MTRIMQQLAGRATAQGIAGALAGEAAGVEFVSERSDLDKLSRMPCEQPREQIEGIGTRLTRACAGSAGILGGSGGGAAIGVELCAQAVSSSASSKGVSARGVDAGLSNLGLLVDAVAPLGFGRAKKARSLGGLVQRCRRDLQFGHQHRVAERNLLALDRTGRALAGGRSKIGDGG